MNAILGLTHILKKDLVSPTSQNRLEKIDTAGRHLLSVISDILDLSKIESGKLILEKTDFQIDQVLDQVKSMMTEQSESKGLTFNIEKSGIDQAIKGDPTRLRQALINYAANAVKFTLQGSVTLRAKVLEQNGNQLEIKFEVQDTGIGIEPNDQNNLFQPFEQADASTTRQHGGTGLGLAITRHLAILMDGEAGVESQPGRGSTFWFTAKFEIGEDVNTPTTENTEDVESNLKRKPQRSSHPAGRG